MIGESLKRLEDPRLIRGDGRFVGDIEPAGTVHAVFVRSTEARGRIIEVDLDDARAMPGVVGVYGGSELGLTNRMPNLYPAPPIAGSRQAYALALEEVAYVGEPVVVVVAATGRQAVDAAERVFVDYEVLEPVVHHLTALDADSPLAHTGIESNLITTMKLGYGDVEEAFELADRVVSIDVHQHRGACAAMEPRGVVAHRDALFGQLTVWSST